MRKYNAFQLKCAMAGLMVLDHLGKIPGLLSPNLELTFHVLSRCVAVFFAYLAVEGFLYTRNRFKYVRRLFGAAGLMLLGSSILGLAEIGPVISNNIFLTLAMGVTTLCVWFAGDDSLNRPVRIILGSLTTVLAMLLTEGGVVIIPFMLVTYLLYKRPVWRNLAYMAFALCLFFMSFAVYPTWSETLTMLAYNSDFMFITVVPILALYNGQRGPNTSFSKYFFYVFYPAHLWLIAIIAGIIQ